MFNTNGVAQFNKKKNQLKHIKEEILVDQNPHESRFALVPFYSLMWISSDEVST